MADQKVFSQQLITWWTSNRRKFPWRKQLPLWKALLVEVMLQRTKAEQVRKPFIRFNSKYRTADELSSMSIQDAARIFKTLGLNWRVPLFHDLAHELVSRHGRLKRTEKQLQRLPGVGPYVASATLSMHGNVRAVIIDTNTVRIMCRVTGRVSSSETRRKRWVRDLLEELTPHTDFRKFNYALLDLGAMICTPGVPDCPNCPIMKECSTGRTKTKNQINETKSA